MKVRLLDIIRRLAKPPFEVPPSGGENRGMIINKRIQHHLSMSVRLLRRRRSTQKPGVSRAAAPPQDAGRVMDYPEGVAQPNELRFCGTPLAYGADSTQTWGGAAARLAPGYGMKRLRRRCSSIGISTPRDQTLDPGPFLLPSERRGDESGCER